MKGRKFFVPVVVFLVTIGVVIAWQTLRTNAALASPEGTSEAATVAFIAPGDRNYQSVIDMLRSEGHDVQMVANGGEAATPLTEEAIADVEVLILGAMSSRLADEGIATILRYVEAGGDLIVLVPWLGHHGKQWDGESAAELLKTLGLATYDTDALRRYAKRRFGEERIVMVRGEIVLKANNSVTAGIENFCLYTGNAIDVPPAVSRRPGFSLLAQSGRPKRRPHNLPVILGMKHGKGQVIVALDFLEEGEVESFGMNGANYKLIANMIHYLSTGRSHPKPQGYFTKYFPGIEQKVKPRVKVLFIAADLGHSISVEKTVQKFKDGLKRQLGLDVGWRVCRIAGPGERPGRGNRQHVLRLPQPQSAYESDEAFFYAVVSIAEKQESIQHYDLVVVLTSGYAKRESGSYGATVRGLSMPSRGPTEPYGVVVFGKSVGPKREGSDQDEIIHKHGVRDMTHVLMYEFGRSLGFPRYVVSSPYIMGGFGEDSKLEYSPFFVKTIACLWMKRAEGLLFERGALQSDRETAGQARLKRAWVFTVNAYKQEKYRDCIVTSARIIDALKKE